MNFCIPMRTPQLRVKCQAPLRLADWVIKDIVVLVCLLQLSYECKPYAFQKVFEWYLLSW